MPKLTLAQAETIVDATLEQARAEDGKPLAVVILDEGGHLKIAKREDGAGLFRVDIAIGKAWGAVAMGAPSRVIAQVSNQQPQFVQALTTLSGGRILPNPGGVLIKDASGELLGAVGVSGDTPEHDEAFAVRGVRAAGLASEPDA